MEIVNGQYKVYIHTNKTNNKKYVGITKRNPLNRWKNGAGYKGQPKFYRAICKYGWNGFIHEIIASNLTENEAKNFEILLIDKLDTISNGYNVSKGGDTGNNVSMTEEERIKRRIMFSGEGNPRFGVKLSQETKDKISKSLTGRKNANMANEKNPMAKKVYYNGTIYFTVKDCAKAIGVKSDTLTSWLSKSTLPPREVVEKGIGYEGKPLLTEYYIRSRRHFKTECEGIIFNTPKECAAYYNINSSTMVKWLNGTNPMPEDWKQRNLRYID